MRIAIAIILSAILAMSADAQLLTTHVGSGSFSGVAATPCNAGQLDWSDTTGCNLTLYFTVMR
jgi:hypothetical protein